MFTNIATGNRPVISSHVSALIYPAVRPGRGISGYGSTVATQAITSSGSVLANSNSFVISIDLMSLVTLVVGIVLPYGGIRPSVIMSVRPVISIPDRRIVLSVRSSEDQAES